jgi:hypothetical protein
MEMATTITLTAEEKTRWKPMLQRTWDSIAYDAIQCCGGTASQNDVIEFTLDAGRAVMYGSITNEEMQVIYKLWNGAKSGPAFRKWLKTEVFKARHYCI